MKVSVMAISALALGYAVPVPAEATPERWKMADRKADAARWQAFSQCDLRKLGPMHADDVEFYHDTVGLMRGIPEGISSHKESICGIPNLKPRGEAVTGTIRIVPLRKSKEVYGAIVSEEHEFHASEKGAPEVPEGQA